VSKHEKYQRKLYGKIRIKGRIKLLTGLHIGAADLGISIGDLDSRVVRDPVTSLPYIPGSSLKGKLRSLLERAIKPNFNRKHVTGSVIIRRHECTNPECEICRLFGATRESKSPSSNEQNSNSHEERNNAVIQAVEENSNLPSRIIVRDAFLTNEWIKKLESIESELPYTEWKSENTLDRITSAANPRHIERVPAGSEFDFEILYSLENKKHVKEDLKNIFTAMKLLEDDYLGKSGSRGYGKIQFLIDSLTLKPIKYYKTGNKGLCKEFVKKEVKLDHIHEILEELGQATEKNSNLWSD